MTTQDYARRIRLAETEIAHQRKEFAASTFAEDRAAIAGYIAHLEAVIATAQERQGAAGDEIPLAA